MIALFICMLAAGGEQAHASVVDERALVFEQPDVGANVVRRLYFGEIVSVDGELTTDDGRKWLRLRLGPEMVGYAEAARLMSSAPTPRSNWRPARVIRDELPLGVSTRIGAETFGGGVNLRYLGFSRLGLSGTAGSVVDGQQMRGTALSAGLVSYVVLWNLSPLLEAGVSRLSYHKGDATLRISVFYLSSGLEWMFDFGFFANAMVTYYRSMDIEVGYDVKDVQANRFSVPQNFGVLDPGGDGVLQGLRLGGALGYAF